LQSKAEAITRTNRFLLLLFVAVPAVLAHSQTASPGLSADLARYYFATPEAEVADRADLDAALGQMVRLKGQVTSAAQLLAVLRQRDVFQKLFAKHEDYLHLRCSQNRRNAACDAEKTLESDVNAKTAFLDPEVLAIPEDRFRTFLNQEPGLAEYRFALSDIRRGREHLLPESEQALLDEFQPQIGDWQYDLYQQAVRGISFGTVQTSSGPLDVVRQRNLIAANPDGGVREEGFKRWFAGYASQRDLLTFALIHTVRAQNLSAKAHHYADAPARKYDSLYCVPQDTRKLLAAMAQHGDMTMRYEKIRSQDMERSYRQPAHAWDMFAPLPGLAAPITSLSDARSVFHEAFAGLGTEYRAGFDALLDPATGRADRCAGRCARSLR
jgi:oligoendopeptidase F